MGWSPLERSGVYQVESVFWWSRSPDGGEVHRWRRGPQMEKRREQICIGEASFARS